MNSLPGMERNQILSELEKREVPFKEVARKFVSYYKPFTFLFVADLVCATLLAAIDLAFPQILNFFVRDFFVNARDAIMGVLPWVAAGLVAMYVVRSLCQYFISCWATLWVHAWRRGCAWICSSSISV